MEMFKLLEAFRGGGVTHSWRAGWVVEDAGTCSFLPLYRTFRSTLLTAEELYEDFICFFFPNELIRFV